VTVRHLGEPAHDDPLFYSGDELHKAKVERLRSIMRATGLDALLFVKHDAVRYVTGFYAKGYRPFLEIEYMAIITAEGRVVLGSGLNGEPPRAHCPSRVRGGQRSPTSFATTVLPRQSSGSTFCRTGSTRIYTRSCRDLNSWTRRTYGPRPHRSSSPRKSN
jgi:Creatinase/Prolidase N-terminal domain